MSALRVALAQINTTVGDLGANAEKVMTGIGDAIRAGAHVVAFPELTISGYPPEDLLLRPGFLRDSRSCLESLAARVRGITAVVGFPELGVGPGLRVFNSAAVIRDRAVVGVYRKMELPNYGVFDEKRYFEPGREGLCVEIEGVRLGLSICEDAWVEGGGAEKEMARLGAEAALNISASPFHAGKLGDRVRALARFARALGRPVFYNNLVGGQDELVFDGGGLAMDRGGRVTASAPRFEEHLLVVELGAAAGLRADKLSAVEESYRALVLGTRDYALKNGFGKVVLGLSGGVDSSLTAAVAVDALGADNVVGVTMPSRYNSAATRADAELLARNLGIEFRTVPIEPVFEAYLEMLGPHFGPEPPGLEVENLQARIRGNILMALSNRFGWLALTTGNKSETAVGYSTLYGDTAGGFAVIKDVPKTLVYKLCEYYNDLHSAELIPASALERPPTAELRFDQKDEDTLPPYEVLDAVLRAYVEEDRAPGEMGLDGIDPELAARVAAMVDRNEYKRRQSPPGVKITPRAFGRDRRLPITNRYRHDRA